jgi:hypothetical protein
VTTKRAADRSTAKAGAAVRTAMRPIEALEAGGGTHGLMVGHVAPEGLGGSIDLAAVGDEIVIAAFVSSASDGTITAGDGMRASRPDA